MTAMLLLVLGALIVITTMLSALSAALLQASPSAIRDRLVELGRENQAPWIETHSESLEHAVAFFRTFGRLSSFLVMLLLFQSRDADHPVPLDWVTVGLALAAAGVVVWLTTSVIAAAIARYGAVGLLVATMPLLIVFYWVTRPALWIGSGIDAGVRRLMGALPTEAEAEHSLLHTIEDSARAGGIDRDAAAMMRNAVEFKETVVSEIMTPRTQVEGIEYTDDLAVIRGFIETAGHSRIPVYRSGPDHVVGILYVKDLIRYLGKDGSNFQLSPLLRNPIRVPESKPVSDLLRHFQHSEIHLAIVVDEFGGTAGLVTIEDVLEEIVGEIYDEHEPSSDIVPEWRGDAQTGWVVDGRVTITDFAAASDLPLPLDGDFDTVAGLALAHFGRVPAEGERFWTGGACFTVISSTPTRIVSLSVELDDSH